MFFIYVYEQLSTIKKLFIFIFITWIKYIFFVNCEIETKYLQYDRYYLDHLYLVLENLFYLI